MAGTVKNASEINSLSPSKRPSEVGVPLSHFRECKQTAHVTGPVRGGPGL